MDVIIRELKNKCHNRLGRNHFAVIFRHKKLRWNEKLAFTMNIAVQRCGKWTIHAEEAALKKCMDNNKEAKSLKIDILVVRLSKDNTLGQSLPCTNCVNFMSKIQNTHNIVIKNVYYSACCGNIYKEKFCDIVNSDKIHPSTGFCRKANI